MTWDFKFLHKWRTGVGATGGRPLSKRVVALERDLELVQQALADIYQQSVYLGGLQSALVWIERRRESHVVRHERYLDILTNLDDVKDSLARFSNSVGAQNSDNPKSKIENPKSLEEWTR